MKTLLYCSIGALLMASACQKATEVIEPATEQTEKGGSNCPSTDMDYDTWVGTYFNPKIVSPMEQMYYDCYYLKWCTDVVVTSGPTHHMMLNFANPGPGQPGIANWPLVTHAEQLAILDYIDQTVPYYIGNCSKGKKRIGGIEIWPDPVSQYVWNVEVSYGCCTGIAK